MDKEGRLKCVHRGPRLRCGIHIGHAEVSLNPRSGRLTYTGKVMNRAARIASKALGGQVRRAAAAALAQQAVVGGRRSPHTHPPAVGLLHRAVTGVPDGAVEGAVGKHAPRQGRCACTRWQSLAPLGAGACVWREPPLSRPAAVPVAPCEERGFLSTRAAFHAGHHIVGCCQ